MTCTDVAALLPAYALEALDEEETALVRAHLAACRPCRRELATYGVVAAGLALSAPAASPSRALRSRVLAAAGVKGSRAARESRLGEVRRWLARKLWPAARRLSPALAGLAIVVSLVATWQAVSLEARLAEQAKINREIAARLEARERLVADLLRPGLTSRQLRGTEAAPAAAATLYLNPEGRTALLAAEGLPPLAADRVYQVWLIRDGRRTSGGFLVPDERGGARATIEAPDPLASYEGMGVTVEPRGGSPGPTGPRVLGGTLSES